MGPSCYVRPHCDCINKNDVLQDPLAWSSCLAPCIDIGSHHVKWDPPKVALRKARGLKGHTTVAGA